MGTTLTGTTPATTYDSLIKVTDNGPLSATAKYLSDGLGNDSVLALSTARVGVGTNSPNAPLEVQGSLGVRIDEAGTSANILSLRSDFAGAGPAVNVTTPSPLLLMTANTERMRITSLGNVGIGTASPTRLLSISAVNPQMLLKSTTTTGFSELYFGDSAADNGYIGYGHNGDYMYFGTNNSEKMRITSAGAVGIGTNSISNKLSVASDAYFSAENTYSIAATALTDVAFKTIIGYDYSNDVGVIAAVNQGVGWKSLCLSPAGGNVGIGTTSPVQKLSVVGGSIFTSRNDSAENIIISDGTTNSSIQQVTHLYLNSGGNSAAFGDIVFRTKNSFTEMGRFTQNGLCFNGDTAAANALDDYEEGYWTMGISFGGASTGVTYSNNTGAYTKIGRQVTVTCLMIMSSKGTATGTAKITGLPFAVLNNISAYSPPVFRLERVTYVGNAQAYATPNATTIDLEQQASGAGAISLYDTDFVDDSTIMLSLTYFV